MNLIHRLDPELVAPLKDCLSLLGGGLNLRNLITTREIIDCMTKAVKSITPAFGGVKTEERKISGHDNTEVSIRIYQPENRPDILPALLWIHGGGYVFGNLEIDDPWAMQLVKNVQCMVVSVEYRLAPEHPFPGPLDDCYAALKWLSIRSNELGVDKFRIAVGGLSGGGGLAAGLALLARDRNEVDISFQLLMCPMIDDRNIAPADNTNHDTLVWSRENNLIAWRSYLGCEPGGKDVSYYAAPARATDLAGLPPAYISVCDLDLFCNENIEYAKRLIAAGVPTELHVYPRTFHGFQSLAPDAEISKRFNTECDNALKRALHSRD